MRLPSSTKELIPWAHEIVSQCLVSRARRLADYRFWRSYFYEGTAEGGNCFMNKCGSHVDRLAGFLFSPAEIRFLVEFDITNEKNYLSRAATGSRYLNREFHRRGVDLSFAQGLESALVKDSSFLKVTWTDDGLEPWVIQPEFMGVYREDIPGLDRQEAFVHSTYLTRGQFQQLIFQRDDAKAIMAKIEANAVAREKNPEETDYFRQIVIGGNQPVVTPPQSSTQRGNVSIWDGPYPSLAPEVQQELIRVDELWVQDDERQDYTTLRLVEPDIIIAGDYKRQNLSGVKGEHGFHQICANETPGYFWGMSELKNIHRIQDLLNTRIDDFNKILGLQVDSPYAFTGFSGITAERMRALKARGGYIAEDNPSAKATRLAPEMPPDAMQQINQVMSWFDELGGFSPIMTGQGEPGVRAGMHAQTLLKTSSPRIKDRALLIERQLGDVGDFCFKLLQAKEARLFHSDAGEEFTLAQLPDDYRVTVDSHSGSPAFSEDSKMLAFNLAKAGAIDAESLLELTQPPMLDTLIARVREKAAAEAKFAQEHPELAAKQKPKSRKR